MPRAVDLSYVVYQVTDLDLMETFMNDFGLVTAGKSANTLFLRTAGSSPYVHVSHLGEDNRFVGGGFKMETRADLEILARLPGSSPIEPIEDAPGGGWRVRMTAPRRFSHRCRLGTGRSSDFAASGHPTPSTGESARSG